MHGGVSHVDTFDPKPNLTAMNGSPCRSPSRNSSFLGRATCRLALEVSAPRPERHRGERAVSAHGSCIDDICVIRSMNGGNQVSHGPALLTLHTGTAFSTGPAWERGFSTASAPRIRTCPASSRLSRRSTTAAPRITAPPSCPLVFRELASGTAPRRFREAKFANLAGKRPGYAAATLQLLRSAAISHTWPAGEDARLEARIEALELTFRMQMEAPDVMDLSQESDRVMPSMASARSQPMNTADSASWRALCRGGGPLCAGKLQLSAQLLGRTQRPAEKSHDQRPEGGQANRRTSKGTQSARLTR